MIDIDAIEQRAAAATPPGPWHVAPDHEERDHAHVIGADGKEVCRIEGERDGYDGSAEAAEECDRRLATLPEFIAASITDVPALLAEVRRLAAENATLRERLGMATTFDVADAVVVTTCNPDGWLVEVSPVGRLAQDGSVQPYIPTGHEQRRAYWHAVTHTTLDDAFAALASYRAHRATKEPTP